MGAVGEAVHIHIPDPFVSHHAGRVPAINHTVVAIPDEREFMAKTEKTSQPTLFTKANAAQMRWRVSASRREQREQSQHKRLVCTWCFERGEVTRSNKQPRTKERQIQVRTRMGKRLGCQQAGEQETGNREGKQPPSVHIHRRGSPHTELPETKPALFSEHLYDCGTTTSTADAFKISSRRLAEMEKWLKKQS